jgi:hypothetical protein
MRLSIGSGQAEPILRFTFSTPGFRQAVVPVGQELRGGGQAFGAFVEADRMVRRREDHSRLFSSRGLVDVVKAADIRADDFLERAFDGHAAEVNDRAAALGQTQNCHAIA